MASAPALNLNLLSLSLHTCGVIAGTVAAAAAI